MIRLIGLLLTFAAIFVVETSLFTSLPHPISTTPFVIVIAIYLLQARGIRAAVLIIPLHGILLDGLDLFLIPLETISYSIGALVAFGASHSLFSNRSFYGVTGVTLSTLGSLGVIELLIYVNMVTFGTVDLSLETFLSISLWRAFTGVGVLFVIYSTVRTVRRIMRP
ncbi:hypothetical protein HOI18_02320 [Candidatus Uhrbacteria bacterium]|jgi:hypothetical protein|nr:hypothetical protein [Candidatus Uhrbacteria bacterium]